MTLVLLLALSASADEACARLCTALDDVEETCEAAHGDGGFCEAIGTVEETCDPADGGTTETCPTLCGDVGGLSAACGKALGGRDPVCSGLAELVGGCVDGVYTGPGGSGAGNDVDDEDEQRASSGCDASGGASLALFLPALALVRRQW